MTKRRNAFTLMEILIVLAILGFGMGLIMEMTSASARHSERVEEDTIVQLACEKMMNDILAGDMSATVGISTPIPDAPNWETTVELLDGPIDKLVAIRITARRFENEEYPSADGGAPIVVRAPQPERVYVMKEWARRDEIKTRVVKVDASGQTTAVDGTGETVANDMTNGTDANGGALGASSDPFAAIDQAMNGVGMGSGLSPIGANDEQSSGGGRRSNYFSSGNNAGGGLGGTSSDASGGLGGLGGISGGANDATGGLGGISGGAQGGNNANAGRNGLNNSTGGAVGNGGM